MKCDLCAESNVGPEHEITEKHMRNKVLYDYSRNRKQFAGNRKGVVVTCSVKTSFLSLDQCSDAKIKISAKPDEQIKFEFCIKNESKKEDVNVIFIQMAHSILSHFTINDHGLQFGCNPVTLKPKGVLQKVCVTFKSNEIGQYEMPIIMSFRKPATGEGIIIMRDMVVFVEDKQTKHEKVFSPYAHKEVLASKFFKTTSADRSDDMFRIPKSHKTIYANALKTREDAPEDERKMCKEILDIFNTGVTEDNYMRFFHNLLWYEETIVRINLKKYNMSGVQLVKRGEDAYALYVPGLGEKRPSLMLGDLLFVKPQSEADVMFEGIIGDISGDDTVLVKGLHAEFKKHAKPDTKFDIRFFMSRMPAERMHQAVSNMSKGKPDQSRVFPHKNCDFRKLIIKPIKSYFNELVESNPEQRCVVEHIVAGSAGKAPYLVHGPPGTGKTVTLVEAILQLVQKKPKNRILVCTDSNMAADHVATMIMKYADRFEGKLLLRASSKFRVWETLPECLHRYSNGHDRESFEPVSVQDFMSYHIVVTTLSHAAKFAKDFRTKHMERPISHLFIDEAAQASEPACLIPICGLLSPRGALVLAGDPLQLGPVVISHHARRLGLGLSLMERLKETCPLYSAERNDPNYTVMLKNNFRSDPHILQLPNDIFYKGQLRAHAAPDPLSRVCVLGERAESSAVVFHGVLSKEQKMGKSPSFFNNMEAEIVQRYITQLITQHRVQPEDIGVVTPYIRQVYRIKSWLHSKSVIGADRIEVGTVEAFQGKEKRVIIISTVRANCGLLDHDAKFQLGFLVDDKRFNVALTRAKAKAVIIGNPMCLQKDTKWRAYMQKCRDLNSYYGFHAEPSKEAQQDILQRLTPLIQELSLNKTKA